MRTIRYHRNVLIVRRSLSSDFDHFYQAHEPLSFDRRGVGLTTIDIAVHHNIAIVLSSTSTKRCSVFSRKVVAGDRTPKVGRQSRSTGQPGTTGKPGRAIGVIGLYRIVKLCWFAS